MTTRTRTAGAPDLFKVVGTAAWLNFEGAARTVIRGHGGEVTLANRGKAACAKRWCCRARNSG